MWKLEHGAVIFRYRRTNCLRLPLNKSSNAGSFRRSCDPMKKDRSKMDLKSRRFGFFKRGIMKWVQITNSRRGFNFAVESLNEVESCVSDTQGSRGRESLDVIGRTPSRLPRKLKGNSEVTSARGKWRHVPHEPLVLLSRCAILILECRKRRSRRRRAGVDPRGEGPSPCRATCSFHKRVVEGWNFSDTSSSSLPFFSSSIETLMAATTLLGNENQQYFIVEVKIGIYDIVREKRFTKIS